MTTVDERRHSVTRRAEEKDAASTLRTQLTVRLREHLYPYRGIDRTLYTTDIVGKWIYVFQNPSKLLDEIYAAKTGWRCMLRPGRQEDVTNDRNSVPHRVGAGFYGIPDEEQEYYFFLSPIQLSPGAVSSIIKAYQAQRNEDCMRDPSLNDADLHPVHIDEQTYHFYAKQGMPGTSEVVSRHTYKNRVPDKLYVVLMPDPYAWVEDIQFMGHLPALHELDKFLAENAKPVLIAEVFQQILKMDPKDELKVSDRLASKESWWNSANHSIKQPKPFAVARHHPLDSGRFLHWTSPVDAGQWQRLPHDAADVLDLRKRMYDLEAKAVFALVGDFATEIAEWIVGIRHHIVDEAAVDSGGESLCIALLHFSFVTERLVTTEAGKKVLFRQYKLQENVFAKGLFKALTESEETEPKWYKAIEKTTTSTIKLVNNFAAAIHVAEEQHFGDLMKKMLCKEVLGLHWKDVDPSLVPKLWGKPVISKIPDGLIVPAQGRLAKLKNLYTRYRLASWFEKVENLFEAINVCLALNKILSEKTSETERAKAGLEIADAVRKFIQSNLEEDAKELARASGADEDLAAKAAGSTLARVGFGISIIVSFIQFHDAVNDGLEAYYLDGNYRVAALQGIAALTFGAAALVAGLGICAGTAAIPVVGWIVAALGVIGGGLVWLANRENEDQWQEVARFSYLGKYYAEGEGKCVYKDFYPGASTGFWKYYDFQLHALNALLAGFVVKGDKLTAIDGKITVYPRFVVAETKFEFIWQFDFKTRWAMLKAEVSVGQGAVKVTQCDSDMVYKTIAISLNKVPGGGVQSFTLTPLFSGSERPSSTQVLTRCQPESNGPVVPMEEHKFEIKSGPAKRTYTHWGHATVDNQMEEIELLVS